MQDTSKIMMGRIIHIKISASLMSYLVSLKYNYRVLVYIVYIVIYTKQHSLIYIQKKPLEHSKTTYAPEQLSIREWVIFHFEFKFAKWRQNLKCIIHQ